MNNQGKRAIMVRRNDQTKKAEQDAEEDGFASLCGAAMARPQPGSGAEERVAMRLSVRCRPGWVQGARIESRACTIAASKTTWEIWCNGAVLRAVEQRRSAGQMATVQRSLLLGLGRGQVDQGVAREARVAHASGHQSGPCQLEEHEDGGKAGNAWSGGGHRWMIGGGGVAATERGRLFPRLPQCRRPIPPRSGYLDLICSSARSHKRVRAGQDVRRSASVSIDASRIVPFRARCPDIPPRL